MLLLMMMMKRRRRTQRICRLCVVVVVIIIIIIIINNLPADFIRSLCYEEADVALLNLKTAARVHSKLAALKLRTADRYQQDSKLRQTQAAISKKHRSSKVSQVTEPWTATGPLYLL